MRSTMSHGTFEKFNQHSVSMQGAIIYMRNITFGLYSPLSFLMFHTGQIDILCAFPLCPMPLSLAL